MNLSDRVNSIEISGIRQFYNKVRKVDGALSLTLGEPDFNVPSAIKRYMSEALDKNITHYTSNEGLLSLREKISSYLDTFKIHYNPEEICVTVGGSEGLSSVFGAIVNPNDKVLIPSPGYPAYSALTKLYGGCELQYKLKDDFSIDIENLKKLIEEEKPKAIVISYPSNPTGATLSKKNCLELYELLKDKEIFIITDEIYSGIVYEDEYNSLAQFQDLRDKIIYVSGFSKLFSMTGFRLGYVCATSKYIKGIIKYHQYNVSCAHSATQYAVAEGFDEALIESKRYVEEFKKRRDYIIERLQSMGIDTYVPGGAFYVFPCIKKYGMSSQEFCEKFLNQYKVAIVPGDAFSSGGEGFVRISYAYSMEQLKYGMDKLEKFINNHNK
ncbi:aminotransferase class I/II-fold pyridoxal phosphate-dependent enzyme [uncultured Clostridium sp.]|mgnify:CR=1 FL=1|uniref:pyridoxal phosphate-dependent aminotransferase n=1 Tax=uncultured Clostridium sp. TaxID=59620 RepID=UPI0025FA9172|nr:aminotransferase class I/II-fold pyridoxal phosphate-dependent enzyme [uncultured Clostridium sp.]